MMIRLQRNYVERNRGLFEFQPLELPPNSTEYVVGWLLRFARDYVRNPLITE